MSKRELKRSLTVVGDIFSSLTIEGLNRDFKKALYNSVAFVFVLICLVSFSGVYFILQPFLKPLLWALLCGSALHPFKETIALKFRSRINSLESSNRPLYVGIVLFPFCFLSKLSDKIGNFLVKNVKLISQIFFLIVFLGLVLFYTPIFIFTFLISVYKCVSLSLNVTLDICNNTIIVSTVVLNFLGALFFLWRPETERFLSIASVITWLAGTAWISNFASFLRIIVFLTINLSFIASFGFLCFKQENEEKPMENPNIEAIENNVDPAISEEPKKESTDGQTSIIYIRHLIYACMAVVAISIPSVLYFAIGLLVVYILKHLWFIVSNTYKIDEGIQKIWNEFKILCKERENVLFPPTLKVFLEGWKIFKFKMLNILRKYCDSAASVVVILVLLAGGVIFSIFMAYQAYREGIFLVQASGNIINTTLLHNPKINEMIADDWRPKLDDALNDAYIYIREWIATMIRDYLKRKGIDPTRSIKIEQEALQLWDRAYQAWVQPFQPTPGAATVTVTQDAVSMAYYNFLEQLQKTPEVFSWDSGKSIIQENMSMLKTGLDSVLAIVWGNMSLLGNISLTLLIIIFGGGISIINFVFNWVIFLTALFYLLNSSHELYKPVEMMTQMCPEYGKRLALAVELSCREVLAASLKLSVFYGLWTWLIHTIFMSNLVYMPAVFAAILGVVPVLGTYWACIPAVFDIWLLQGSGFRALGLFVAQLIPTAVVETTIYNEIKGSGHPYLTGLSVAGGIFWLGIEGAIVGPVILCIVFTLMNMLSNEMPST